MICQVITLSSAKLAKLGETKSLSHVSSVSSPCGSHTAATCQIWFTDVYLLICKTWPKQSYDVWRLETSTDESYKVHYYHLDVLHNKSEHQIVVARTQGYCWWHKGDQTDWHNKKGLTGNWTQDHSHSTLTQSEYHTSRPLGLIHHA